MPRGRPPAIAPREFRAAYEHAKENNLSLVQLADLHCLTYMTAYNHMKRLKLPPLSRRGHGHSTSLAKEIIQEYAPANLNNKKRPLPSIFLIGKSLSPPLNPQAVRTYIRRAILQERRMSPELVRLYPTPQRVVLYRVQMVMRRLEEAEKDPFDNPEKIAAAAGVPVAQVRQYQTDVWDWRKTTGLLKSGEDALIEEGPK